MYKIDALKANFITYNKINVYADIHSAYDWFTLFLLLHTQANRREHLSPRSNYEIQVLLNYNSFSIEK